MLLNFILFGVIVLLVAVLCIASAQINKLKDELSASEEGNQELQDSYEQDILTYKEQIDDLYARLRESNANTNALLVENDELSSSNQILESAVALCNSECLPRFVSQL